jgi:hypothetical protein
MWPHEASVTVHADRDGMKLETPQTDAEGKSEWSTTCDLPCEGLQLRTDRPYRVVGSEILASDPFALLPHGGAQVVDVRAKSKSDRSGATGLLVAGLVVAGLGLAIAGGTAVALAISDSSSSGGTDGNGGAAIGAASLGFGLGALIFLVGSVVATIGGINLANAQTSVSVEAASADSAKSR